MCNLNKVCSIVGAGENKDNLHLIEKNDYIIASDGGYNYLKAINLTPNLLVGDFDSLSNIPSNVKIEKLKVEKDETDTFICVQEGQKNNCNEFKLFCCTGGRIDHTIANLQLIAWIAKQGYHGYLFDGEQIITAITSRDVITFDKSALGTVSIFSHDSESRGVEIHGLKYTLSNGVLTNYFPLAVSNSFVGKESSISCENGLIFIVFPTDCIKKIKIEKMKVA